MQLDETIKIVAAKIEQAGGVKASFGDPIREAGLTIIPVASVMMRGGGGGGKSGEEGEIKNKGKGIGMGLTAKTVPVGFIEVKEGGARFVEIIDKTRVAIAGLALGGLAMLLSRSFFMRKK